MNSAQSPETQLRIQQWREKARQGTLTKEEQIEIIAQLRKDRGSVVQATSGTKVRKTAEKKTVNADDLLSELDNL